MAISVVLLAGAYIGAYVTGSARTLNQTFTAHRGVLHIYSVEMLKNGHNSMCFFHGEWSDRSGEGLMPFKNGLMYPIIIPEHDIWVKMGLKQGFLPPVKPAKRFNGSKFAS